MLDLHRSRAFELADAPLKPGAARRSSISSSRFPLPNGLLGSCLTFTQTGGTGITNLGSFSVLVPGNLHNALIIKPSVDSLTITSYDYEGSIDVLMTKLRGILKDWG